MRVLSLISILCVGWRECKSWMFALLSSKQAMWELKICGGQQYKVSSRSHGAKIYFYTETEASFQWHFRRWSHQKLSFWQLFLQPVTKVSHSWQHFRFCKLGSQCSPWNIHTVFFVHGDIMSSWKWMWLYLPISFRVTSLALGQSYDCPSASEVTLKDMGKIYQYQPTTKHNKTWTVCMIHGMMTSSNGNIFRVTGHLCGEFTGHQWIPHTKASDTELWCFLWSLPE